MIVSKDQFRILKERWRSIEDDNYEGIDTFLKTIAEMEHEWGKLITSLCKQLGV